jgi:hypothetical protein
MMMLVAVVKAITPLGLAVDVTATISNTNHVVDTTEHWLEMLLLMLLIKVAVATMIAPLI